LIISEDEVEQALTKLDRVYQAFNNTSTH